MSGGPYATTSENAFVLGMDTEELYCVFGEGIQAMSGGLSPALYDAAERKAHRVRDLLLAFGVSFPLIQQVEAVSSRLERAGSSMLDAFATKDIAHELSSVMDAVRGELDDNAGTLYDCGIMTARLALCLRALRVQPSATSEVVEQFAVIYRRELNRVAPILGSMLAAAEQRNAMAPSSCRTALLALRNHVVRYDGGSSGWLRTADALTGEVFASLGAVIPTDPLSPPPQVDAPERLVAAFVTRRSAATADVEPARAVAAQRALLEECQRALGDEHELTLGVYSDLAMSHVRLGDFVLGADLALDAAERSERAQGDRHPVTAYLFVRAVLARLAGDRDGGVSLLGDRLGWLIAADVVSLDDDLRVVRAHLFDLLGWDED